MSPFDVLEGVAFSKVQPDKKVESGINTKTIATFFSGQNEKKSELKPLTEEETYSSWEKQFADRRLPSGIINLDTFYRNLDKIAAAFAGSSKQFRVATKSIRVPYLINEVLKKMHSSSVFCYAAEEAEFLFNLKDQGVKIDDFVIAYPTVQKSDVIVLRKMQEAGAKVTLVLDSKEQMEKIANYLAEIDKNRDPELNAAPPIRILVDYDMSIDRLGQTLGALRSPVKTEQDLRDVLRASKYYSSLKVVGVMAYEAVVAGLTDENPDSSLNPVSKQLRKKAMPQIAKKRAAVPRIFNEENIALEIFNGGGTGSLNFAIKEDALTEVTAGSGLLCSHLFDDFSNLNNSEKNEKGEPKFKFEPSIYYATQLTRFPNADTATVLGAGVVASGEMGLDRLPKVVWPKGLVLTKNEGAGEVQTPLVKQNTDIKLTLGQPIFWRPAKAGEPAERMNSYLLSENGVFVGEASTYRGFGKCFII